MDKIDRYLDLLGESRVARRVLGDPSYRTEDLDAAYKAIPPDDHDELERRYQEWAQARSERVHGPAHLNLVDRPVGVGSHQSPRAPTR